VEFKVVVRPAVINAIIDDQGNESPDASQIDAWVAGLNALGSQGWALAGPPVEVDGWLLAFLQREVTP